MRKPSLHPKEKSGTQMDGWDLQPERQVGPLMGLRFGPELAHLRTLTWHDKST